MYSAIWEYRVPAERAPEFERAYGPDGAWAQLFARAEGYVRTDLWRDAADGERYLTVDVWTTPGAYETFQREYADEYAGLDADCDRLTEAEQFLGRFSTGGAAIHPDGDGRS